MQEKIQILPKCAETESTQIQREESAQPAQTIKKAEASIEKTSKEQSKPEESVTALETADEIVEKTASG